MIPGIVAGGLNRRIYIENLAPLGLDKKTKYYRFIEDHAYSYGPYTLGETPSLNNLRVWEAYQDQDQDQIILKNSFEEHVVVENVTERLNNLSFTFDQNGFPLVVWEINKQIYLRWYDPVVSDIVVTNIGDGHSPFIALETFNENLKPTRNILLVYINSNKQLVHRYQTDRWSEEFLIKNDVIDIIGFGSTPHNNIKIVYVNDKNVQDEFVIETIATERLGLYEFDTLYARNIIGDVSEIRYKDSTTSLDTVELPITMELVSTTSEIGNFLTYENVEYSSAVELPITMEVVSCVSDFKVKEIGWHRLYPEDIANSDVTFSTEIQSVSIRNSSIVYDPEDIANSDVVFTSEVQSAALTPGFVYPENESRYSEWSWINKNSNIALSNDRITSLINPTQTSVDGIVKSVISRSTYKKYVELKIDSLDVSNNCSVGIAKSNATLNDLVGRTFNTWELFADGNSVHRGVSSATAPYQEGDVIGIAIDIEAGKLWWAINGVWLNGGDPENGLNPFYTNLDIENYNIISAPMSSSTRISLHVPDDSWTYTIPVGFESWLDNTVVTILISGDTADGANFESYNSQLTALNFVGDVTWSIVDMEYSPTIYPEVISVTNGNAPRTTTFAVNVPASNAGDLLILHMSLDVRVLNATNPANWHRIFSESSPKRIGIAVLGKISSGEPAHTISFTLSGGAGDIASIYSIYTIKSGTHDVTNVSDIPYSYAATTPSVESPYVIIPSLSNLAALENRNNMFMALSVVSSSAYPSIHSPTFRFKDNIHVYYNTFGNWVHPTLTCSTLNTQDYFVEGGKTAARSVVAESSVMLAIPGLKTE